MTDIERAQHTWDTIDITAVRRVAWLAIDAVGSDVWQSFSDGKGPVVRTMELLAERRPSAALAGAALVCGDMESERIFFEHTPSVQFASVDGYDLSQESLNRFVPDGIEWRPHHVDCNRMELPVAAFDLVVVSHGAHHIQNLEAFFAQARQSLRPRGLLYMYEWIGPTYLQIPRRNRFFATALLLALFPRRRTRRTHMGKVKGLRYLQDPPHEFDPSEACNSLALYPNYAANFTRLAEYRHGGITYPMFEGLAQNMAQDRPLTKWRLEFAVKVERWLTRLGLVHPLFVVAVGERKP